jgi:hypothetical protein
LAIGFIGFARLGGSKMPELALGIFVVSFAISFMLIMMLFFKTLTDDKKVYHVVWSFDGKDQATKYDIFIKATDIAKVWKTVERKYGKHGTIFYHRIEVIEGD